jgi:polysaccharide biosynthesis transport protein
MLQANQPMLANEFIAPPSSLSAAQLYTATLGFLRRRFPIIAVSACLILALACLYLVLTPPKFSGQAVLLIDTHKNQVFQPQQSPLGDLPIDSATIDTQIDVLRSENIGLSVVRQLHLDQDPEFIAPSPGLTGWVMGFISQLLPSGGPEGSPPSREFQLTRRALSTLEDRLSVKRSGLTYDIEIDFQSLNPDRAAQVANAVAEAYVTDILQAKYDSTRRAAGWLQDRLKELREQSTDAERAVVAFRAQNNIIDTGSANGQLLNQQQITTLDNALTQDRSETAEAKARLDRVNQILQSKDPDPTNAATATVTDSLHDDVITKLRQQYLEIATKVGDWTVRYGSQHLAVVNLRNQMQLMRVAIRDELQRIAETYKSEYEIAKAREDAVQKSLDKLIENSHTMNEAQVTLHSLDSSSQTYRSLYDNFLQHYTESVQQQSFPVTDARLITQATRPLQKSSPKAPLVLALASLGGVMLGIGAGMLREISDHAFRTTTQVEERLQVGCIGVLPLSKGARRPLLPAPYRSGDAAEPRTVLRYANLFWSVADAPFSRFAETIRSVKVAADFGAHGKQNKVIGVTSSLPHEGKSTVAMALAQTMALGGRRVILVDCDLRNPSLSHMLAPTAECGVLDAAFGKAPLADVLWTEPASNLAFLPAAVPDQFPVSSDILGCAETRKLFDALRETYDHIIVDLSPLAPVVDARVATHLVDSFLLVVEWGRTDMEVVEHALGSARGVYDNLLGVVLNKVDMKTFARYEHHRESYYRNRKYLQYGCVD